MISREIKQDLASASSATKLIDFLSSCENDIYLIGGYVRDMVLGKESKDLDFVLVDEDPKSFTDSLAEKFEGKSIVLDETTNTMRLVLYDESCEGYSFDFTGVTKNKLEEDFLRRDFTINALAVNLKKQDEIIDKFNGLEDLKNKKINPIKLENLKEDPLRMLRGFRFAATLGARINPGIKNYIKENIESFNESIASERIQVELFKMLDADNSYKYFLELSEVGLLEKIFPELIPCKKVPENSHHHLGLYDHSIYLLKTYEEHIQKIPLWAKEHLEKPFRELDSPTNKAICKIGCLFHDIGKPDTWEIKNVEGEEKHTFISHEKVGADITKNMGERLKLSSRIIETIARLVRYHLRPFQLSNNNEPITDRALYRFFRDVNDDTPNLLMLCLADHYATQGPKVTEETLKTGEKLLLFLYEEYKKYQIKKEEEKKKPKLLDGNEIMKLTGIKPGKSLGDLIKTLDEAIGIGEINTKEEAVDFVVKSIV